jgi:hypothetical protein
MSDPPFSDEPIQQRRDAGGRWEAEPLDHPAQPEHPQIDGAHDLVPQDYPEQAPHPLDAPQPDIIDPHDYDEAHVSMDKGNHQHWLDEGWTIWDVIEGGAFAVYRRLKSKENADGQPIGPTSP